MDHQDDPQGMAGASASCSTSDPSRVAVVATKVLTAAEALNEHCEAGGTGSFDHFDQIGLGTSWNHCSHA
jgi:hypothetical protein